MMISLDFCRKTRNFADRMNKRTLYIFSLWIATITVLLSTVVSHHHHMDRICMVQEQCQEDGNINDEHTDHHDQESNTDRGNCRVHQMHHFVTNAKVVKGIRKLLADESHQFVVLSCSSLLILPRLSLISVRWQHVAQLAMLQEQREKERDYKQGYNRLQNAIKRMEYYSGENMAKAKDIERLSTLEYENGEISYVEYASALQEAIDMRLKQAEVVNEYNEAVLALMALNNSL